MSPFFSPDDPEPEALRDVLETAPCQADADRTGCGHPDCVIAALTANPTPVLIELVKANGHDATLLSLGLTPGPINGTRNHWSFAERPFPWEGALGRVIASERTR